VTGATRRINHGRGHRYELDGQPIPGVTTILKVLDKPALNDWRVRTVAEYCYEHRAELAGLAESAFLAKAKKAPYQTSSTAAARGTQIHAHAEQLAAGQEVDVPAEHDPYVRQYLRLLDELDPKFVNLEFPVFNRTTLYAGTADAVAEIPALGEGRTLLDLKTGKGVYGETALQLAAYRWAEIWLDDDGNESPVEELDIRRSAVAWVGPDSWALYPVDTELPVFRLFQYAAELWRNVTDNGLDNLIDTPLTPAPPR
jgi:hypothetical protein